MTDSRPKVDLKPIFLINIHETKIQPKTPYKMPHLEQIHRAVAHLAARQVRQKIRTEAVGCGRRVDGRRQTCRFSVVVVVVVVGHNLLHGSLEVHVGQMQCVGGLRGERLHAEKAEQVAAVVVAVLDAVVVVVVVADNVADNVVVVVVCVDGHLLWTGRGRVAED